MDMRTKLVIVLLVLGLVAVGFSAFGLEVARAGVPHTVDGAVGPSTAPGLGNPSNPASAAFYLTNKPAEPIQTQQDLGDADGTPAPGGYAYYGKDIGNGWSWAAGDNVVVVVEAIRGQNGWTGANYTTSSDGALTTLNVDSLPTASIEQIPTIALQKWPGAVNVMWTGLTDGNGNVVNYTVYRAPTPGGVYTRVGFSGPQVAAGAMNFNNTPLAPANYCYKIAVDYRRDATGGLYTTTGTSEAQCVTLGTAPTIVSTSPVDGEVNVLGPANIVVVFSETMNPTTVTWSLTPPGISLTPVWNPAFNTLTLTHGTPFTQCTQYTMRIGGHDQNDDFPLVTGSVPNPWTFNTNCPSPQVTVTTPPDGATGVSRTAVVVVTFSKTMDPLTVSITTNPAVTFTYSWNSPTNTIVTASHATAFAAGTVYQATAVGCDTVPNCLASGGAPNPWSFTTNRPPVVAVTAPVAALCWAGSSLHDIAWTVTDDATPIASLVYTLRYTSSAGSGTITTGTGLTSPYGWTVPAINAADAVVIDEATDGAGDMGSGSSGQFQIDSTRPTVMSATPTGTSVPSNTNLVITFSEGMTQAATVLAVSINGGATLGTPTWSGGNTVLTLQTGSMAGGTAYTVTIATTAVDDCSPGNGLLTAYVWSFTTGRLLPSAPSNVAAAPGASNTITVTWNAPTTFTDGSTLSASLIQGYYIERAESLTGARTNLTPTTPWTTTTYQDSGLTGGKTYYYWVKARLTDGRTSADSTPANAALPANADLTWLWILLIIIIVVILVIALVAWRRRKPTPAAPAMSRTMEEPPAPMEESPPDEGMDDMGGGS